MKTGFHFLMLVLGILLMYAGVGTDDFYHLQMAEVGHESDPDPLWRVIILTYLGAALALLGAVLLGLRYGRRLR